MTIEQKELEQKLFKICLPEDCNWPPNEFMCKPFTVGCISCASDSHILIFTKEPRNYDVRQKPVLSNVIPLGDIEKTVNVKSLREQLVPTMIAKRTTCLQCEGEGTQECSLGHDRPCEECGGDGEIKDPNNATEPDPRKYFNLFGVMFAYKYLDKLLLIAEALNLTEIKCLHIKKNGGNLFYINDTYSVVVMPVMKDKKYNPIEINL